MKGKRNIDRGFERGNSEAAAIILSDPERHGGESSGLVRWARLYQRQHADADNKGKPQQLSLIEGSVA